MAAPRVVKAKLTKENLKTLPKLIKYLFKYSKNAEFDALSNINLKIKSGQTVGIIGGTGSSKTTLVNLISRLYDTTSGDVFVGGRHVKE